MLVSVLFTCALCVRYYLVYATTLTATVHQENTGVDKPHEYGKSLFIDIKYVEDVLQQVLQNKIYAAI